MMSAIRRIGTTFRPPLNRAAKERFQKRFLSSAAALSRNSLGRLRREPLDEGRTEYERDIGRIVYSAFFSALQKKTQIHLLPTWTRIHTRYTHSWKVAELSAEISRALGLNEDLTRAIGLGHDLGHTPFGHEGESALNKLSSTGFKHNRQSLRVVDEIMKLNLTWEVRNGILCHNGEAVGEYTLVPHPGRKLDDRYMPATLEGCVVRLCDKIAYLYHDLWDAINLQVIKRNDIPRALGLRVPDIYKTLIANIIEQSAGKNYIAVSPEVGKAMDELLDFNAKRIFMNEKVKGYTKEQVNNAITILFGHYLRRFHSEQATVDYIAAMTDQEALSEAKRLAKASGKKIDLPRPKY